MYGIVRHFVAHVTRVTRGGGGWEGEGIKPFSLQASLALCSHSHPSSLAQHHGRHEDLRRPCAVRTCSAGLCASTRWPRPPDADDDDRHGPQQPHDENDDDDGWQDGGCWWCRRRWASADVALHAGRRNVQYAPTHDGYARRHGWQRRRRRQRRWHGEDSAPDADERRHEAQPPCHDEHDGHGRFRYGRWSRCGGSLLETCPWCLLLVAHFSFGAFHRLEVRSEATTRRRSGLVLSAFSFLVCLLFGFFLVATWLRPTWPPSVLRCRHVQKEIFSQVSALPIVRHPVTSQVPTFSTETTEPDMTTPVLAAAVRKITSFHRS